MQNRHLQSVKWLAGLLLSTSPLFVSPIVARAQVSAGEIVGTVTDPSGAVLPGVQIEATHLATNQTFSTKVTSVGNFLLSAVPIGDYRVLAQLTGFKAFVSETSVFTGRTTTLNIQMVLGALTDQVTVRADTAPLLQATSAEVSTVLERHVIMDLPVSLNEPGSNSSGRRQIEQFEFLTPGVTGTQFSKSFNGTPDMSQEAVIDGVALGNGGAVPGFIGQWTPPYEAVEEFKVSSSLYPAGDGRGFGVTNFTMKSGTNEFHGDAFYIVNNDKFNARSFFAPTRQIIRQNNYGFAVGGPIKKNKTFFYGAYEEYRLRTAPSSRGLVTIPSLPFRSGDFSQLKDPSTGQLIPIYDPATTRDDGAGGFTRDPFTGNMIPSSRFSAVAQRVIGLMPTPDSPGIVNNYFDRSYGPVNDRVWSIKIDHNFNDRHRVNFSEWVAGAPALTGHGPLGNATLLDSSDWPNASNGSGTRFNYEWVPRPNLINHFAFGFSSTGGPREADVHKGNKVLQVPGIDPNASGFTSFYIPGMPEFGDSDQQPSSPQRAHSTIWNDTVTWVHGKHQVKFGADVRYDDNINLDSTIGGGASGAFSFSNLETSLPDSPNASNLGNGFASFLLGQADSAQRLAAVVSRTFSTPYMAYFVDDKIQVTPKLVITPGLRYEVAWPYRETHGRMSALDLHLANPGAGGLPGAYVFGEKKIEPVLDLREWGPRLGLAYQWNSKTVIRAGYGWIYAPTNGAGIGSYQLGQSLFAGYSKITSFASTNGGVTPGTLVDQGFPTFTGTLPTIDPAIQNGSYADYLNRSGGKQSSTQNWQLSVQRDLGWSTVVDVAYVANKGSHLPSNLENLNQVPTKYLSLGPLLSQDISSSAAQAAGIKSPYPGFSGSVNQALLPFPQFLGITEQIEPVGNSTYQSMQMKVQKRTSNGLAFLVSYTFSKNLTDTGLSGFAPFNNSALDTANRGLEKALAGNDVTHNLVMSWVYEVPFGKGSKGLAQKVAKGWIVGAVATYRSGTPIGIGGGPDLLLFNGGNRPNRVPAVSERVSLKGGSFDPAVDLYLNINAFSQPAPFTFGNVSRLEPTLRTFPYLSEDVSAIKRTYVPKISEAFNVEFRAEFFNIFNRTVFGGPSTSINDPTSFGIVGYQANSPRTIQFSLKVNF